MQILQVAQFWQADPYEVANWPAPFFDDCEEYMLIQIDKDPQTGKQNKEKWTPASRLKNK